MVVRSVQAEVDRRARLRVDTTRHGCRVGQLASPTGIVCVGVVAIVGVARCTVVPLLVPRPDAVIEPPSC